jgi:Tfp pilus assembly protein PilN
MWRIRTYLSAASIADPEDSAGERRRRHNIENARNELRAALSATASSLARLSDPTSEVAERLQVLDELPLHRSQQQRILATLLELLEEAF